MQDDNNKQDKLTQTRGSFQKISCWQSLYLKICPCLTMVEQQNKSYNQVISRIDETKSNVNSNNSNKVTAYFDGFEIKKPSTATEYSNDPLSTGKKRKSSLYVSNLNRKKIIDIQQNLTKSTIQKWHSYPIYQYYKQNQIQVIGTNQKKLLALISSVRLHPSKLADIQTKKSMNTVDNCFHDQNALSNVDKYWSKRYYLFDKFDEGISLDQQSWSDVVPQAIAQYIASKIRCDTVMDAFCGAGGVAIKLANTCYRIIANDINPRKLKCLSNNAKVYGVDNIEMHQQNYLNTKLEPDIIFLHPSTLSSKCENSKSMSPSDLSPPLSQIMRKTLEISKNFVLLLPGNMDPNLLADCITTQYMNSQTISPTCSIKIQKIFLLSTMRYLAVYMGSQVQNQICLNDELAYIYELLKTNEINKNKKVFKDRKIIKHIRQKYGMIKLLNYVLESQTIRSSQLTTSTQQTQKQLSPLQKFYSYLREKNLIQEQKLTKIIQEQQAEKNNNSSNKRHPLVKYRKEQEQQQEQQKYVSEQSQRTISYYSTVSNNRLSIDPNSISNDYSSVNIYGKRKSNEETEQICLRPISAMICTPIFERDEMLGCAQNPVKSQSQF